MADIEEQLERLYAGTLICPFKGCYEKDSVRYLNREVLMQHTRHTHVVYMDIKKEATGFYETSESSGEH